MSGGIDSAATALILKRRGYAVTGVTFDFTGNEEALASASLLAERLGIRLLTEDLREEFDKEVVGYFTEGYLRGETPAPCSYCNTRMKWRKLAEIADRHGILNIATGHYIRITSRDGLFYVTQGVDPVKDQSYYLWNLGQHILSRALTPLGNYTKMEIRSLMEAAGFPEMSRRKESMGVCFLDKEGYVPFLKKRVPQTVSLEGGVVVDREGHMIGSHEGYPFYTVGQKKGFDLSVPGNWYVLDIDPEKNRLVAGPIEELHCKRLSVRDYYLTDPEGFFSSEQISVKIRGLGLNPQGYCRMEKHGEELIVYLSSMAYAPAKGQPVVFYQGDDVVGGGYLSG